MKTWVKGVLVAAPLATVATSVGVYFAITNKNDKPPEVETKTHTQALEAKGDDLKIFPQMDQAEFYKFIKIDNSGKPYFDDEFIARFINDVLKKVQFVGGRILWNFSFRDSIKRDDLLVSFIMKPSGNQLLKDEVKHDYHLKLSKQ